MTNLTVKNNKRLFGIKPPDLTTPSSIVCSVFENKSISSSFCYSGVFNVAPPLIYISINSSNSNFQAFLQSKQLSLNIPTSSSIPRNYDAHSNNSGLFALKDPSDIYSIEGSHLSIQTECPINLICRAEETFQIYENTVIVGRVEKTLVNKGCLTEGNRNPDMDIIDPVVCFQDHGIYRSGKFIADAFSVGNSYCGRPAGVLKHVLRSRAKRIVLAGYSTYLSIKERLKGGHRDINEKIEIPPRALIYPLPTVLLGSNVNGKPNYNVIANCGIISDNPPIVYVSSRKNHFTNIGIRENQSYSINVPRTGIVKQTDYCGIVSGNKVDKSQVFKTFYGSTPHAPLICECPVNIECKVIKTYEINNMEVFIGEVIETHVDESCISDGQIDISKVDPILYALNRKYWSVGKF